jgi:hypothetical protein
MSDKLSSFHKENAQILLALALDEATTEHTRIQIFTKLYESKRDSNFFETMFRDKMSYGSCPNCGHENYWLIPESDLNQMGHITSHVDTRVKAATTVEDCPEYQEACDKKKVTA